MANNLTLVENNRIVTRLAHKVINHGCAIIPTEFVSRVREALRDMGARPNGGALIPAGEYTFDNGEPVPAGQVIYIDRK